ncbi:MAG: NAD(P) transhydrogenase subunit alpha [Synechococcaceae bacterium WBA_2_066]|nr:NAD(P) transhydrogenase subunit alpha [Synechococcaceae bacterium WB6_1A_059]NBP32392.1 NAD(P) transhydrogenase subunit alpha [Synechococcaceae bacterium WB6_1B_055]NBQ18466.1 NAD(P) transhydrogenase subunit alpha [Synechococcaceae bacterium WB5_2A_257]NBR44929.1 NAD(P) transhydrogenase subunit alpha [Synechococcaceae bacterium WB5_2B_268]NBY58881.1 NAD(P) transhydrogenase subunit alpha [Synechococcaceae bacterium LLD_019]NCU77251.1 NAD(P) transhydrogenase subunit alpha [Synechococcaceae ba
MPSEPCWGAASHRFSTQLETRKRSKTLNNALSLNEALWVLLLGSLLGLELIGKVPPTLHTPLMSGANAISGITLLASIVLIAEAPTPLLQAMGAVSLAFALFNVVGGFLVTDRMLAMFRRRNDQ